MASALIARCVRFRFIVTALAAGLMVFGIARLPHMPVDVLPESSPVLGQLQTEAHLGGLLTSTLLNLLVIPAAYLWLGATRRTPEPTSGPGARAVADR